MLLVGHEGEKRWFSRRQNGRVVMVCACFSALGKRNLAFFTNKIDSVQYREVLREFFITNIELKHPQRAVFQCHSSEHTKN